MKDKKHLAVGKRGASLTALALAACLLFGLSVQSVPRAQAVDFTKNCAVTAKAPQIDMNQESTRADVVVDLYQIAKAGEVPGYDTYSFDVLKEYQDLESLKDFEEFEKAIQATEPDKTIANGIYQNLTQEAAKATFADLKNVPVPAKSGKAGEKIEGLESGLYLLIPRGADLKAEEYVTSVGEGENEKFATIAYSREWIYTFEPQLVAVPSKDAVDGSVATSNPGEWLYEVELDVKSESAIRFGNLEIVKNLSNYAAGEPASFVFQIEASKNGEKVYSDVVTATFTGSGSQTLSINGEIPVGASVEVTEIYSGISYVLDQEQNRTQRVEAIPVPENGAAASVEFTNIYQGTTTNGGAITNHFEYNAGNWDWTQQ